MTHYDDPAELALLVASCPRPLLVGLDVDGVLAPIVGHADDARLLDGIGQAVSSLASQDGVTVAVVSGRSVGDLARFGFGQEVALVGSHGMETRDRPMDPLTELERNRLERLAALAETVARVAGTGAWIETKPASVVLHVRQVADAPGRAALDRLAADAAAVDGTTAKPGSGVLELFTRAASKGTAMADLRVRHAATTMVFVGDDVTDEEAFEQLADHDIGIKVGDGDTAARHRLRDPDAVRTLLTALRLHLATP